MTDLERFVELYRSVGIELSPETDGPCDAAQVLRLQQGATPQFIGFTGFHTIIAFDADGKFLWQGFWE